MIRVEYKGECGLVLLERGNVQVKAKQKKKFLGKSLENYSYSWNVHGY